MENRKPFLLTTAVLATATALAACSGTQPTRPASDASPEAVVQALMEDPSPISANVETDAAAQPELVATLETAPEPLTQPTGGAPVQTETPEGIGVDTATLPTRFVFSFRTNSASLSEADYEEIKRHADYLVGHPNSVITISGHADIRGPNALNEKLARARAEAVARALMENGVSEGQILVTSHGEDVPVISEDNWQENRRVEIEYIDDYMLSER